MTRTADGLGVRLDCIAGDFPEVIDRLLLCTDCVEEEHAYEFDEGGTD